MYIFLNDRKKSKYITIVQTLFHHLIAMKDKNILICVGIIIYIAMSGIDRFVYHIPNIIYIPPFLNL